MGVGNNLGYGVGHGVAVERNCLRSIGDLEKHLALHDVHPLMIVLDGEWEVEAK